MSKIKTSSESMECQLCPFLSNINELRYVCQFQLFNRVNASGAMLSFLEIQWYYVDCLNFVYPGDPTVSILAQWFNCVYPGESSVSLLLVNQLGPSHGTLWCREGRKKWYINLFQQPGSELRGNWIKSWWNWKNPHIPPRGGGLFNATGISI